MGIFFAYSIKSALCLTAFYLFYKLLLSKETFHRFNRMALLIILALSVIIPFAAVSVMYLSEFIPRHIDFQAIGSADAESASIEHGINASLELLPAPINNLWLSILLIYILGFITFTLLYFKSLYSVTRLIRKGKRTPYGRNHYLVVHQDNKIAPFSWMKYIVISATDLEDSGEVVIMHEQAHLCKGHSIDLIFAELCLLFQWYNPAAWLLFNELQNVHEYEADQFVLDQGINEEKYQLLIIKKAVGTRLYSMANSFNHSKFKKRITMMLQKKSNSWARLKYTYVLPLAAISIVAFARPEISQPFEEISSVKISHFVSNFKNFEAKNAAADVVEAANNRPPGMLAEQVDRQDTTVYLSVEYMPEFVGGDSALLKFIGANIRYPEKAKANKVEGRVSAFFTVETDGSVSNPQIAKGIDPELDAEALRVLGSLPKFTPGRDKGKAVRVKYSVPVRFRLPGNTAPAKAPTTTAPAILEVVEDNAPAAKSTKQGATEKDTSKVYETVEQMAEFPGGEVALQKFISDSVRYPVEAAQKGIQGRVPVTFTINRDGSVSDIIVSKSIDPLLDAESIRVIRLLPKFIPAKDGGKVVRVKYSIPVRFRLQK
jgi:TonB family protein